MLLNINEHRGYAYEYSWLVPGSSTEEEKLEMYSLLRIFVPQRSHAALESDWSEGGPCCGFEKKRLFLLFISRVRKEKLVWGRGDKTVYSCYNMSYMNKSIMNE